MNDTLMMATESNTDWNLVIATIFLGFCAILAPYISKWVERNVYAPKLIISFKLAPPFCHRTILRNTNESPVRKEPVYFFRFKVENIGKSQARKCEVVLENLWIYDSSNNPKKYPNFSPVNLNMIPAFLGTQFLMDLNPKRFFYCDIGHIASEKYQREIESQDQKRPFIDTIPNYSGNDLRFVLDSPIFFYSQPNCLIPGTYVLQFGIYSENAAYKEAFLSISWSGKWQEQNEDMFREIVIAKTDRPIET